MNRFIIDKESALALDQWAIYNPGYVVYSEIYFEKFEVHFLEDDHTTAFLAICERKKDKLIVNLKVDKKLVAQVTVTEDKSGEYDFSLKVSPRDDTVNIEELNKLVKNVVNTVLAANAFLLYGNLTDDNVVKISSKNDDGKAIVFRTFEDKVYAVQTGFRKSPEGVFPVRGHFRKYKDGKIIWVEGYLKGLKDE